GEGGWGEGWGVGGGGGGGGRGGGGVGGGGVGGVGGWGVGGDILKILIITHFLPNGIFSDPGIVFIALVNGLAQPVERFGRVVSDNKIGGQPKSHLTIGRGNRQQFVSDKTLGLLRLADANVRHGTGRIGNPALGIFLNDGFQNGYGLFISSFAEIKVAFGGAQQRVAGLQ